MELAEFLKDLPITDSYRELLLKRQKSAHEYHSAKGSTWDGWNTSMFVAETAAETLDIPIWLWMLCEYDPIFKHLAPKISGACSEFVALCECRGYSAELESAAEYK